MTNSQMSFYAGRSLWWSAGFIFLLALAVRLLGVSSNPVHVDELYHLLAGRSWAEEGTLRMLDGEYLRSRGFTALVGYTFELFGRSDLYIARLPSVLAGALLTSAIFVWLSRQASIKAGWLGAMLFCFSSYAIVNTQFTRFYALQALAVWLGATAIYKLLALPDSKRGWWLIAVASIAFLAAIHLQITTVIAIMALALWVLIDLSSQSRVRVMVRHAWSSTNIRITVLLLVAALVVLAIMFSGGLLHQFRYTPRWAAPDQDNFLYYFYEFFFTMPILWLFLPLAGVIALARWPRPALFCIVMAVVPLVLQSLGGMKSSRYVFYALPFLFAIWGMAAAILLPATWKAIEQGVAALQQTTACRFPAMFVAAMVSFLLAVSIAFAIIANPIYRTTLKSLARDVTVGIRQPSRLIASPPDWPWSDHAPALRSTIGNPSVLLVGDDFNAIAYLENYDLLINTHRVEDIPPKGEFVLDPRTGRRAISRPETIAKVVSCYEDGAVVVSDARWRTYIGISNEAADTIEQLTQPVTPAIPGFHVFKWQGQVAAVSCDDIHVLVTGHRK
jgi:hypothetical protein